MTAGDRRENDWPHVAVDTERVVVVLASYNTMNLTAQVIYSLYRRLRWPDLGVLVVDNASTDGSRELLAKLVEAGLCDVILNDEQRYHGPALNQAFDHLAWRQADAEPTDRTRYVWVLDSDCVVVRADALEASAEVLKANNAAIVGQAIYDDWHQGEMMGLHSLLIDPKLVWQPTITPFQEHGSPSQALQASVREVGLTTVDFPFTSDHYVAHVGRGTLRTIAEQGDAENRYFDWAISHNEPHFMQEECGERLYTEFVDEFHQQVGPLTVDSLITACLPAE